VRGVDSGDDQFASNAITEVTSVKESIENQVERTTFLVPGSRSRQPASLLAFTTGVQPLRCRFV